MIEDEAVESLSFKKKKIFQHVYDFRMNPGYGLVNCSAHERLKSFIFVLKKI